MDVAEHVLHHIVLEIKYEDGIVYLDRCGSLALSLERVLDKPFKNTVSPNMEYGQLTSPLEHFLVRYGPKNFLVDQAWLETTVRLQKLAPLAWAEVAKRLDVESKVTRCGLRILNMWPIDDLAEGQERLRSTGLISETDGWTDLFGKVTTRTFTGISERGGSRVRVNLDTVQLRTEGRVHPDDKKFVFENAIQLDLEYGLDSVSGAFSRERLQSFLRASLKDSEHLVEALTEVLGAEN